MLKEVCISNGVAVVSDILSSMATLYLDTQDKTRQGNTKQDEVWVGKKQRFMHYVL
jgi:hypothetical protein